MDQAPASWAPAIHRIRGGSAITAGAEIIAQLDSELDWSGRDRLARTALYSLLFVLLQVSAFPFPGHPLTLNTVH
jgi:hypothetical protein